MATRSGGEDKETGKPRGGGCRKGAGRGRAPGSPGFPETEDRKETVCDDRPSRQDEKGRAG